jgi:biotin operon repressor/predicted nucleic acid-binding Zn ribbon protein
MKAKEKIKRVRVTEGIIEICYEKSGIKKWDIDNLCKPWLDLFFRKFEEYHQEYKKVISAVAKKKAGQLYYSNFATKHFFKTDDFKQEALVEFYKIYCKWKKEFTAMFQLDTRFNILAEYYPGLAPGRKVRKIKYHDFILECRGYVTGGGLKKAIANHSRYLLLQELNNTSYRSLKAPGGNIEKSKDDDDLDDVRGVDYYHNSGGDNIKRWAPAKPRKSKYGHLKNTIASSFNSPLNQSVESLAIEKLQIRDIFNSLAKSKPPGEQKAWQAWVEQNRRAIIFLLKISGWNDNTEIATELKTSRQTIHKHLNALKNEKIKVKIYNRKTQKHEEIKKYIKELLKDSCIDIEIPYFNQLASKPYKKYCKQCGKEINHEILIEPYYKDDFKKYGYDKKSFCSKECYEKYIALYSKLKDKNRNAKFKAYLESNEYNENIEFAGYESQLRETKAQAFNSLWTKTTTRTCKVCGNKSDKGFCSDTCKEIYKNYYSDIDWNRLKQKDKRILFKNQSLKNKAKNKVEYESKEKHYSNVEFFNNIWNGSGESYVIGKGWTVLYGGGFKFKRRKDGNWYRVKKNLK